MEVHVIGGGKGESIVLKLPDGQWGVVDCYSESITHADANPTTQFLRMRGVTSLLFVCLTHPHVDHFLGMVKLIEEFRPREFWRFGCLSHEHIRKLLRYNELEALGSDADEFSRSNKELLHLFGLAFQGASQRTMAVCRAHCRMTLIPSTATQPVPFRIECLSPTGRQIELYERAILECIGPDGRKARTLSRSQHNNISVVLRIVYGSTAIILGGDLEGAGWTDVIRESGVVALSASAVKVSHHGAENGYCDKLWAHFSAAGEPVALIAPAHRYGLPQPAALSHISRHSRATYATCKADLDWAPHRPPSEMAAPLESRLAMRETFLTVSAVNVNGVGRCSLQFDSDGRVDIELQEPAVSLVR